MKAISILSALVFAHAAFAQATDSTTAAAVSTTDSSAVDPATSTVLSSSTAVAATSTSSVADAASSSSASATSTGKKGGNKSSSSSAPTSASSANNAAPTGSIWEDGTTTMTSSDGSPFLLTGVSAACSAFLSQANKDQKFAASLTPMITALAPFTTSGNGDSSAVSKTMTNFCSLSDTCSSAIKPLLAQFNDACRNDFDSSKLLSAQYDMMYHLCHFKEAICAKNPDSQNYCVADPGAASSKSKRSTIIHAREHLVNPWVKRGSSQTYFTPNIDTYRSNNILFLFSSPDMSSDQLCTKCTQQVLTAYAKSSTPNALGQANSPLSGGQIDLFKAVNNKCGSSFVAPIVSAAGSPTADTSGASPIVNGGAVTAFAGALAALAALI